MKSPAHSTNRNLQRRISAPRHAAAFCLLAAFLALPAHSQSASNFKTPSPKAPLTKKEAKKAPPAASAPAKTAESANFTPSRYVSEEELPAYLEAFTTVFTIQKRATDPFGQLQDPNAKPVVKPSVAKNSRRVAPIQATPLSEIVRLIKVTTIMPSERKFLIGTRSIKQGDHLPLSFRGKNINVEVSSVSSQRIEFRNLENGETAALPLSLMPVGMTPGNRGISAPGMTPDRPNAPIDLDGGSL
jgi:hypothetical protein